MQRPKRRSLAGDVVGLVANGVDRTEAVETWAGLRDGLTCMGGLSIANEIACEQILVWNVPAQRPIGLRTQVELALFAAWGPNTRPEICSYRGASTCLT